ncbi:cell division regulator GpsB [Tenuibacillus multivorans]|uniref:DivIVA domain-containing protein n=1 Tax=Tenuibacillus multivorans TaxID=237069 RepID=A0A1H0CRW0_9BACI|nr:cell division regulator GpsB [Tenuibacillus multivorans]GEL76192.1 cell cycle protein GpsB [Tenuibacillus multivorans]SDN60451.1 DivIVA domain-containing protein [Tenuibacillus multivorans]
MKVNLTSQEILDKEFKTTIRGYNQDEVDEFLDSVIEDYETLHKEIAQLRDENKKLKSSGAAATSTPKRSNTATSSNQTQQRGQINYDVLQRLSNLEKAVFGKKYSD